MQLMTFAESAALVGIPIEEDADSIVVQITERSRNHQTLSSVAGRVIEDRNDMYFTGGAFRRDTASYRNWITGDRIGDAGCAFRAVRRRVTASCPRCPRRGGR